MSAPRPHYPGDYSLPREQPNRLNMYNPGEGADLGEAVHPYRSPQYPPPDQFGTNMDYGPTPNELAAPPKGPFASPTPKKRTRKQRQRRRLMWLVPSRESCDSRRADLKRRVIPLAILAIVLIVLFEVYKSDFENWVQPLTKWLNARKSWSWVIPTVILIILNFPPLFGQEIVQLIVGVSGPGRTGAREWIKKLTFTS